jgi:hypothetical protein
MNLDIFTKSRRDYKCKICNEKIHKGDERLDFGGSYRGGSLGCICCNCFIQCAEELKDMIRDA